MENRKNKIRLYFLGSGNIAVPVLQELIKSECIDLTGIGTQDDQPTGRKKMLKPTPVGIWADGCTIPIDKSASVNSLDFIQKIKALSPDFILVVSFGQLLKEKFLSLPKYGCINVHASLLPKYRGASPITASILNGDSTTGITIMKMEKGLDSGPVFTSFEYKLNGRENAFELESALGKLAADNITDVITKVHRGELVSAPQLHTAATFVGKIKKQDGEINWTLPAMKIERMVRAYYPWPGAYFYLYSGNKRKKIQITEAAVRGNTNIPPGQNLQADKKSWIIACGTDALEIKKLVPEGKNEMTGPDFIRGQRVFQIADFGSKIEKQNAHITDSCSENYAQSQIINPKL